MKIVVVGSGASAMIASWAGRAHDLSCWSSSGQFGGQFGSGPFRLVRATDNMMNMLNQLDLPFETADTQPGILLESGIVKPLPDAFADIRTPQAAAMRWEYIEKSRGAWALARTDIAGMCEPEREPSKCIDFDFPAFCNAIAEDTDLHHGQLIGIDHRKKNVTFWTPNGERVEKFDLLIFTCPIEVISRALSARESMKLPHHITSPVDIAQVAAPDGIGDRIDVMVGYDVIWTPVTPKATLMRMSHHTEGYVCEFKAGATIETLEADLAFALPLGHSIVKITRGLRGIVTHDCEVGEMPKGVHAAGPHATGKMHTLDETLTRMMELFA